jgi:muramoyltetrapeptide carboxypeptidase
MRALLAHFLSRKGVEIYTGLPFGHVRDKLTLPVGARARLIARDGECELVMFGYR